MSGRCRSSPRQNAPVGRRVHNPLPRPPFQPPGASPAGSPRVLPGHHGAAGPRPLPHDRRVWSDELTRITAEMPEMPELFRGGNGPDGDKHHLALAGLKAPAPLDEQTAAAVAPAFDVGPDEGGGLRAAQTAASSSSPGGPDGEIAVRTTDLLNAGRNPRGVVFA